MPGVEISRQSTITLLFDFRDFSMVAQFKGAFSAVLVCMGRAGGDQVE
jgi:hypothetical protein